MFDAHFLLDGQHVGAEARSIKAFEILVDIRKALARAFVELGVDVHATERVVHQPDQLLAAVVGLLALRALREMQGERAALLGRKFPFHVIAQEVLDEGAVECDVHGP